MLQNVSEENPIDDSTLQVLSFCYKEMEQRKSFNTQILSHIVSLLINFALVTKITELYNHAAKLSPGNEEILAHLFISYVRLDDYESQKSVALQLYKVHPKNAYYFWAVMSVVLQVKGGILILKKWNYLLYTLREYGGQKVKTLIKGNFT